MAMDKAAARKGNGSDTAARNQTNLAGMNGISHKISRWKANSAQATISSGTMSFASSSGTNWGTLDLGASSFADFNGGSTYTLGGSGITADDFASGVLAGSFIVEELTDLVEAAVLAELGRISERGGVLGAMETGYQRGKIQEESLHYEMLKHTGEYPIIGVNTFRNPHGDPVPTALELARSTDEEKQSQLKRLQDFHARHAAEAPAMLKRLQSAVIDNGNVFEVLMDAVRCCSLGQITNALFEVGGQYRRSM